MDGDVDREFAALMAWDRNRHTDKQPAKWSTITIANFKHLM